MFDIFRNQIVVGILTLISAIAASLAAIFAWSQLRKQQRRWSNEDARIGPTVFLAASGGECSKQGWFHGVWQVENRAQFPIELLRLEGISPQSLELGFLDQSSNGPVETMRVAQSGKVLYVSKQIQLAKSAFQTERIGGDFLFKVSSDPEQDRGKAIRIRFVLREVDFPDKYHVKEAEVQIPLK